jgi:hypothetical protein
VEELTRFLASCEFATPLYFWIGGAFVLLLVFFQLLRKRRGLAIDLQYWKRKVAFKSKRVWVLSILVAIASILMAGVLSDPQFTTISNDSIYGKPVMVVVDISGSMEAKPKPRLEDQRPNFEKARTIFEELIDRRPDVNFGLIFYSTENYVARYFAYKNELLKDTIENREEINYISTGTRTHEALAKARQFLTDNVADEADKAIVLISDLEADLEAILRMSEEMERVTAAGIKIYAIVIGEEKQDAVDVPQIEGVKMVDMYDRDSIDQICEEISAMQISPIREEEVLLKKSLIPFFILPALGVIILCLVLGETRFRKIP